jgi:hypothetical protein
MYMYIYTNDEDFLQVASRDCKDTIKIHSFGARSILIQMI